MDTIQSIRDTFATMLTQGSYVPDKSGQRTIEILGAQFLADHETIFGVPNKSYITREIGWYMSRSLNVNDIEKPVPKIWKKVSSPLGLINSNYGFLIFDPMNFSQLENCILELRNNVSSRRAVMIYTRPSMWIEYNRDGMSDFICTNTVQYFIRQSPSEGETNIVRLFAKVDMRSNDAWAGYRNDYAWQLFIFNHMYSALRKHYINLRRGAIIWNCGSLHVYERNFDLVQHYINTGDYTPHPDTLIITRAKLIKEGIIRQPWSS